MSDIRFNILITVIVFLFSLTTVKTEKSDRNFQIGVRSSPISLSTASLTTTFQDLTANLSLDGNDVTCASSEWVPSREMKLTLEQPSRIHAVSLLMHKYVDVHLEVHVENNTKETVCNTVQKNTGTEREVMVVCHNEVYGNLISVKDLRNENEFFVICEVGAYGVPGTLIFTEEPEIISESHNTDQIGVYIGCGAALLALVAVLIIILIVRRKSQIRRSSEAHSLNTLSMINSQHHVMQQQMRVTQRGPMPSPRPNVVSRSIPNTYDRPISKDTSTIYETIPGDEPPYLSILGEKEIYDDASSSKR